MLAPVTSVEVVSVDTVAGAPHFRAPGEAGAENSGGYGPAGPLANVIHVRPALDPCHSIYEVTHSLTPTRLCPILRVLRKSLI